MSNHSNIRPAPKIKLIPKHEERQMNRLALLNELSTTLVEAVAKTRVETESEIYQILTTHILAILESDCVNILLRSTDSTTDERAYKIVAISGIDGPRKIGDTVSYKALPLCSGVANRQIEIMSNFEDEEQIPPQAFSHLRFKSAIRAPLMVGEQEIGLFLAWSAKADAYGEFDKQLLQQISSLAAAIIITYRSARAAQQEVAKLQEKISFLDSVIENIPNVIYVKDAKSRRYVQVNRACEEMNCHRREDIIGKMAEDIFPTEFIKKINAEDDQVLAKKSLLKLPDSVFPPVRGKSAKNRPAYYRNQKVSISNSRGEPQYILGIAENISETKKVESELHKIYSIVENSSTVIFRCIAEEGWPFEFITENVEQFGYNAAEFMDRTLLYDDIIHPDDVERVNEEVSEYARTGVDIFTQEYRILARDGSVRWIADNNVIERNDSGTITHYQGTLLDITEHRQIQDELKQANIVVNNSPAVFLRWIMQNEPKVLYVSENVRQFGYTANDLISGKNSLIDIVHPDDLENLKADILGILESGVDELVSIFRSIDSEQKTRWIEHITHVARKSDGVACHLESVFFDITKRKKIEIALHKTQERYKIAVTGAKDGLWDWDFASEELYLSPPGRKMLGYSLHDSINHAEVFSDHIHPEDKEAVLNRVCKYLAGNATYYEEECRMRHKNGSYIWIHAQGAVLRNTTGKPYRWAGSLTDITQRRAEAEALLQAKVVVENSPVVLIRLKVDPLLSIEYISKNIDQFGYSAAELMSQSASSLSFVHPDDIDIKKIELIQDMANSDQVQYTQFFRIYTTTGEIRWIESKVRIKRDENGVATKLQGVFIDVSERREAELSLRASEEQLRTMLSSLPIPIAMTRKDGSYVYVNDEFGRLFGASPEEIIKNINSSDLYVDTEKRRSKHAEIEEMKIAERAEYKYKRLDGTHFWGETVGQMIQHSGETVLIACYVDLSERKKMETTLREAKEAAEAATETKSMFLSNMTHELRTPMNGVLGMTSLLLDTGLDEEQFDLVNTIRNSGDTLLKVINDVLDFSKVEAGKLELEIAPFDLASAIEDSFGLFSATLQVKGIDLSWTMDSDVPRWIVQDVTRVRQTLTNLLSNAIKFTDNGKISLRVTAKPVDVSTDTISEKLPPAVRQQTEAAEVYCIQFSIEDDGIGIPRERLARLFQSFSQADISTTRKFGGTGLGLAISRQLCELMGGSIWVESEDGAGSTFHFTIIAQSDPVKARDQAARSPQTEYGKHLNRTVSDASNHADSVAHALYKILLVEDNIVNQKVAVGMLKKCGYSPDIAANGLEALDALRRQHYDIVLMDIHMPEMDGVIATKRIRADFPDDKQPTIIALTANAMEQHKKEYLAAGMDDYLTKPLRMNELQEALQRIAATG